MQNEVVLTAEELFFLGKYMQAMYIDYAYISAMNDIQHNYILHEQRALEGLEEKEIIEEDFGGHIEIPEETMKLFEPVFFGKKECRLDNGEEYRVHIQGKRFTIGRIAQDYISFSNISEKKLEELINGMIRIQYSDVDKGVREKSFSTEQLMKEEYREEAMQLLKGEV